jgi:hypothetical protein
MKTISEVDLMQVTGGKAPDASLGSTASSGSSNNDAVLSALNNIQSSLKDIGKNNNSLFGGNNGLLFMTMALALSRRNDTVVYAGGGGGGGWGHGRVSFRWRASW